MKVLKFGGKSLANGEPLANALEIIRRAFHTGKVFLILSARGDTTDCLERLLVRASKGKNYKEQLKKLIAEQIEAAPQVDLSQEIEELSHTLKGVLYLGEYSGAVKDKILSFGELMSCKVVAHLLQQEGLAVRRVDTRELIKTETDEQGKSIVLHQVSEQNVRKFFEGNSVDTIEVITGFIASNMNHQTTTLGRNGSNYTATLIASYMNVEEVQNWTHVDGIFTADPAWVPDAQIIPHLSFREANELAQFGMKVLHAKTVLPLMEKKIPIRLLNSLKPDEKGTTISAGDSSKGLKAVSALEDVALISLEGRGLLGIVGVDARIFSTLAQQNVSVHLISQTASERGIGLTVDADQVDKAHQALLKEFAKELQKEDISHISVDKEVAVISVIGSYSKFMKTVYGALVKNHTIPYLLTNTLNGKHVSIVVRHDDMIKAINVIHNHLFGVVKRLNIFHFGKGTVGGTLLDQLTETSIRLHYRRSIQLTVFGVGDSKRVVFDRAGLKTDWRERLKQEGLENYSSKDIFSYVHDNHLENVVMVDNTANAQLAKQYPEFVERGFDIVAANKYANTLDIAYYDRLRKLLEEQQKSFFYETNVGAGLPLIDTIKLLHLSGDNILRIRGVFSGSLSYLFNSFSKRDEPFSHILQEAMEGGLTEPDPREDLCGNDVARKLLILAREIDLKANMEDVSIENLIPEGMREGSVEAFLQEEKQLNDFYHQRKASLKGGEVLRYVGDMTAEGDLSVCLINVPENSALGQLTGSDSLFEIFTDGYKENPLVIRGAGAGAEVTARGVYSDLLRLAETL